MSVQAYLGPEARARVVIDEQLAAAGWVVQPYKSIDLDAARGIAVREFPLVSGHGIVDYLLYVDGVACGVLEAKKEGNSLTGVETQSAKYSQGLPAGVPAVQRPLPFAYESTGAETRFTNRFDPVPRSREVHRFHRPETLAVWVKAWREDPARATFRCGLHQMAKLERTGLRDAQYDAVLALEDSLSKDKPRALIQMATGAGKTFTAATESYRLLRDAKAKRICFLVDRGNLGRQTLKEFQTYVTPDSGRKFTELYNVQLLSSNKIDPAAHVVITTIQRLYSILSGESELDPELDEKSIEELKPEDLPTVGYNPAVPVEFFDLLLVDECHRSIYGTWRQVLEYFDAHLVGLTATPSKATLGFFGQNMVFSYTHEQAVADQVNVDFDVYRIRTSIGENGSVIEADGETVVEFRDRLTGATRLVALEEDYSYESSKLDRDVIAADQLRTVIKTFHDRLFTEIFPSRREVPKTLIFAKDDAHADRVVQMLREEFDKPNEFAVKITYKTTGKKPEELLADFRNSYNPRIAVTVDMIATGTDIKPLECVFFLRSVKSRNFFEQMKGRGVRVINDADFQAVTPDAKSKTRFVLIDAVGVTESELNETTPLERAPKIAFAALLQQVATGVATPELASTLGSRLMRFDRTLSDADRAELASAAGTSVRDLAYGLISAVNPDKAFALAEQQHREAGGKDNPGPEQVMAARDELVKAALKPLLKAEVRKAILTVKTAYEQLIDEVSQDHLVAAEYTTEYRERAHATVQSWRKFIEANRDELTALEALYAVPYKRKLGYSDIKQLANAIGRPPHSWTPEKLWEAYEVLDADKVKGSGRRVATDLVALVRYALEQENELVPYTETVEQKFAAWVSTQNQQGRTFTTDQMAWLERIRDVVATSLAVSRDDFEYAPFAEHGGLGGAFTVFGNDLDPILAELNAVLAA